MPTSKLLKFLGVVCEFTWARLVPSWQLEIVLFSNWEILIRDYKVPHQTAPVTGNVRQIFSSLCVSYLKSPMREWKLEPLKNIYLVAKSQAYKTCKLCNGTDLDLLSQAPDAWVGIEEFAVTLQEYMPSSKLPWVSKYVLQHMLNFSFVNLSNHSSDPCELLGITGQDCISHFTYALCELLATFICKVYHLFQLTVPPCSYTRRLC